MTERRSRRGGGHAGHARGEAAAAIRQMPWRIPLNPDRPTEPLPPEGVAAIHAAAMRVLEETDIEMAQPTTLGHCRRVRAPSRHHLSREARQQNGAIDLR